MAERQWNDLKNNQYVFLRNDKQRNKQTNIQSYNIIESVIFQVNAGVGAVVALCRLQNFPGIAMAHYYFTDNSQTMNT